MRVSTLDRWATSKSSFLHRMPVAVKLVLAGMTIGIVVVTWNPWALGAVVLAVGAVGVAARLPMRTLFGIALYPLLFSGVLVLTTGYGVSSDAAILLKTYASAITALTVGFTTPYPVLFSSLGRILPRFVNDALLMTYRSLFILSDVLSNLLTAVHLRGATNWRRPAAALRSLGYAAGNLALSTFDLAQADYEIMRLRGYQGRIVVTGAPQQHGAVVPGSGDAHSGIDGDLIERVR